MKEMPLLIPESLPLKVDRKGGAANIILAALMLEASRMLDDGMEIPHIESVAKSVFGLSWGFLAHMEKIGITKTCDYLYSMADGCDGEDPIFKKYYNFFNPGPSLQEKCRKGCASGAAPLWKTGVDEEREPEDLMLLDVLRKRFQAVAFITSVEVVEAELLEISEVEELCKGKFGWKEGPFAMMNRLGIREVMQRVTEKMEMSHRQEINFPIPKLLIVQAQKNEPWPLNSRIH